VEVIDIGVHEEGESSEERDERDDAHVEQLVLSEHVRQLHKKAWLEKHSLALRAFIELGYRNTVSPFEIMHW